VQAGVHHGEAGVSADGDTGEEQDTEAPGEHVDPHGGAGTERDAGTQMGLVGDWTGPHGLIVEHPLRTF